MFKLTALLFEICLLKKAPQDLPYSVNLLKILVVINIFVNFLLANISLNWTDAIISAVAGVLLLTGFSWICLFFNHRQARFCQTTCALLGTDALISLFNLPVIATIMLTQSALAFLVMLGLIIWYWVITGHIMRNALEQSFIFSLGLTLLYLLISYQVL
jgi:hypothetical protein